ncbi:MAG: ArsR family transcriptional regulator [Rhodanobacteraceae bacterium]|nr:MAG: ArsR family transcriptional regulator [Rhodanobacteraceae bacterium]
MTRKTVLDVLLHPTRMRIVRAFAGTGERTARDLANMLDDVPQATLYRHLSRLTQVGVLTVTAETPVRGALERSYRINPKAVAVPAEEIGAIDPEAHQKYFSVFVASLLEDFGRYIRSGDVDVQRDDVHYLQVPILASAEEFTRFMEALMALINKFAKRGPGEHRIRRTVSIVTLPEKHAKPD